MRSTGRRVCLAAAVMAATAVSGVARANAAVSLQRTDYALGTGETASAMAVGDVDGKNGPDLVAASASADALTVLLNNGDGTFGTPVSSPLPAGCGPVQLELYDFENAVGQQIPDGNLDALVFCTGSGYIVTLAGNGNGTFSGAQTIPVNLDSDRFTAKDRFAIGAFGYYARTPILALADADNSNPDDDGGTFCAFDDFADPPPTGGCLSTDTYPAILGGSLMVPVDFSGAGQQDVITEGVDGLTIWGQDPGPPTEPAPAVWSADVLPDSYVPGSTEFTRPGAPTAIATGDLDGNGLQDIVTVSATGNSPQGDQLNTIMDRGAAGFGAASSFPTLDGVDAIVTGDFDGDGHTDVLAANGYGQAVVQSGDGSGNLGADSTVIPLIGNGNPDYSTVVQAAEADIDDNGTPDVVVLDDEAGTFEVLKNLNPGTTPTPAPTPQPPPSVPAPTPRPIAAPAQTPPPASTTGKGSSGSTARPLAGISRLTSKVKLDHHDVLTLGQAANPRTSSVSLTLTVPAAKGKETTAATSRGAAKSKRVVVGRATIRIPAGAKRPLAVTFDAAGRRLLAGHAHLAAQLTILAASSGGATQTEQRKVTIS